MTIYVSTHLKNCILVHFPDLIAHNEGHDILLAFNNNLGSALHRSFDYDYDNEATCLTRAANIVRRHMLKMQAFFAGSFDLDCQARSMPHSLSAMVAMILNGPNLLEPDCLPDTRMILHVADAVKKGSARFSCVQWIQMWSL